MATTDDSRARQPSEKDRPVTLAQVLDDLVADGLVPKEAADKLAADRRHSRGDVHPLVLIADQKWKDPRNPRKLLHLEALTEWFAEKVGPALPARRPVQDRFRRGHQGDVERVRAALQDPAGRHQFAGSDDRDCRAVHARVGRAVEARAAARHQARHREPARHPELPRRVLQPRAVGQGRDGAGQGRLQRDRELRAARAARHAAAGSMRTTSTSSTSATGFSTTRSSSARATSISSRGAKSATCASASTASCTRSTRSRRR